jgi:hypothetical protein
MTDRDDEVRRQVEDAFTRVVTVTISASAEKEILDAMNEAQGRVVVRLLEEDSPNGCAWVGKIEGWENPDGTSASIFLSFDEADEAEEE